MCPSRRNAGLQMLLNHNASSSSHPSRLQQAFQVLDRDGDGEIRSADLSSFFASCVGQAISDEEVTSMIAMADLDGDGAVGLEEFQRLMNLGAPGGAHDDRAEDGLLREVFRVLDVNQDGLLSREDLKSAMAMFGQALSEEDLDAMVAAAAGQVAGPSSGRTSTTIDFDTFSKLMAPSP